MDGIPQARSRSVDHLQRLYTIVISLALAECLRRLFTPVVDKDMPLELHPVLMAISFLSTVVPYYHGANRHLDATYVTAESQAPKPYLLMLDFGFLFGEALLLFIIALLASKVVWFFYAVALLFAADDVWIILASRCKETPFKIWFIANAVAAPIVVLCSLLDLHSLACLTIACRSICDYVFAWRFYYPR